jgi:hypothetical protein
VRSRRMLEFCPMCGPAPSRPPTGIAAAMATARAGSAAGAPAAAPAGVNNQRAVTDHPRSPLLEGMLSQWQRDDRDLALRG